MQLKNMMTVDGVPVRIEGERNLLEVISKVGTIPKIPLLYIVLSGLVGALSWVAYFRALQLGKVSQIAPIDRLSVVFAVVLAALILKEKVNVQTWVGVGVMAAGAIMVSLA